MKHTLLSYSIGALLYCPANSEGVVRSLVDEKFGQPFSLAMCLEDTIREDLVEEAEAQLIDTLQKLYQESKNKQFYMPNIYIRVREPRQIGELYSRMGESRSLVMGMIAPKFSLENVDPYIDEIVEINKIADHTIYFMPILESSTMIHLKERYHILYHLKDKLDAIADFVLNIRVGGNDLCHAFGFRRHSDQSIHDIRAVSNILSDIMTVFGMDYVISGPVWEYYSGDNWEKGLIKELEQDQLNGFIGKTVIHPKQIPIVNRAYMVNQKDYEDAVAILNWDQNLDKLVCGSSTKERMNEYNTHFNWARKIIILAQIYGTLD